MPEVIRARPCDNRPIVDAGHPLLSRTYFQLLRLEAGQSARLAVPGHELLAVVLGGRVDIEVGGQRFEGIGRRENLWSGLADSVYAGTQGPVAIRAGQARAEVAIAGGRTDGSFAAFRIAPEEVDLVEVGSPETHTRRRIYHILGARQAGRAGNMLVSELYADPGCWNGWPPHKHDTDLLEGGQVLETDHEELYHFRYQPPEGFGAQFCFQPDGTRDCFMMTDGDTFLLDRGYHPTVTSPAYGHYLFTVLVGRSRRSLVQNFKEEYRHLMDDIPGLKEMREKFK